MKRPILLLCLLLMLCGCAGRSPADPTQTVLQALQEQNIAYEPVDLWQTEAISAYDYRGGALHASQAQHTLVFTAGNCLGVLRERGRKIELLPIQNNAALLLASCYIQGNEVLLCYHAEGCDLLWGESVKTLFDAPNQALDPIADKDALRTLAAQASKSPVRFARHLRLGALPEVPTLPAETAEDIPEPVRTAAPYGVYGMLSLRNGWYSGKPGEEPIPESTAEFYFANAIPEYQYADGVLTPLQDNGRDYHPIFADGRFVGQAYWNKDAPPEELYLQFGPDMPLQKQLYTKLERFHKTGDSLAIVAVENSGGYCLVVNGTVLPLYDTAQTALAQLRLDEVQAAVDAQGLTYAKAQRVFSFSVATYEQYYEEPWPPELNRGHDTADNCLSPHSYCT